MVSAMIDLKHALLAVTGLLYLWMLKAEAVEIPLLAKKKHSIQLLTVDTNSRNISREQPPIISASDNNFPVSITFDIKSHFIMHIEGWSKTMADLIQIHFPFHNFEQMKYAEFKRKSGVTEEVVTALAFDWTTKNIYIGVERTANVRNLGKIEVCSMTQLMFLSDATSKEPNASLICGVLLHRELNSLHSLVLDPVDGYMYWLNTIHRRIERAWMNGEHHERHPFHEASGFSKHTALTSSLTLDSNRRALFFIRTHSVSATSHSSGAHTSEVVMCKLYDRTSCSVVVSNVEAFDLDIYQNFVIWTTISAGNNRDNRLSTGLQMCQLNACSNHQIFSIENTSLVESIKVFDASKQPQRSNPNPCVEDNGKCSHLCLLIPGAPWRSCACPIGIHLQEDGLKCGSEAGQNLLLVGAAGGLYSISLDTHDYIPQPIIISSKSGSERHGEYVENGFTSGNGIQKYADIDYDPVQAKIYWIDRDAKAIKSCFLNGSGYEEVITENLSTELNEICVDWLGRNLVLITDGRIELIKLNHSDSLLRKTLVSHALYQPRGLSIDHLNGRIYFANFYGNQPKIESILMDGSERKVFLLLPKSSWVSAIELDVAENNIYWTDNAGFTINKAKLSNGQRMGVVARDLKTPYSITKLGSTIFCNSLGGRSLTAIPLPVDPKFDAFPSKNASTPFEIAESEIYGQMSLKAVHSKDTSMNYKSLCTQANGGCQHICVHLGSTTHKCLCSLEYELQEDNHTCQIPDYFLVFSSQNLTDDLMRASATILNSNVEHMHLPNITYFPGVLAVDSITGIIYWSGEDSSEGSFGEHNYSGYISRTNFNGTGVQMMFKSGTLRNICGLAVDETTGNLFVCNGWLKRIEVISPNGHLRKTVLWKQKDVTDPKFLVINSKKQILFFTNFNNHMAGSKKIADIMSASLYEGEAHKVVDKAGRVTSLALDTNSNRLFWSTVEEGLGCVFALDNTEKSTLVSQSSSLLPTAVTFYNNRLYIANEREVGSIQVWAEDRYFKLIHTNITKPISNLVMAHHTFSGKFIDQPRPNCGSNLPSFVYTKDKNPLKKFAHHQQQQCICQPSAACLCSDQQHFNEFQKKCVGPVNYVLLADGNQLIRYVIDRKPDSNQFDFNTEPFTILPVGNVEWVVGGSLTVDWLSPQQYIYWLSTSEHSPQTELQLKRASGLTLENAKSVSLEQNCTHLFDIALDVLGRQLFVSCSQTPQPHFNHFNLFGYIHVWRIKPDDHLIYIGQVVGGARKSEATNLLVYPKQMVVFSQINVLFYMDHNRQLDSPTIIQCQLNGEHCSILVSTGFSFQYQPLLLSSTTTSFSENQVNRLIYTTTTGLWSRRIEDKQYSSDSKMQDIQHHLIMDANRAAIEALVALENQFEDELSIYFVTAQNGAFKSGTLEMENAVRDAPKYVDQLEMADWSGPMLQIMGNRVTAATAVALELNDGGKKSLKLVNSLKEKAMFGQIHFHSLNKYSEESLVVKNGCLKLPCSHICRPKFEEYRKDKMEKLVLLNNNDASYYDEDKEETRTKKNSLTRWNGFWVDEESSFECMCPLGFSTAIDDAHQCESNIHCASWEFACQDGKSCIHSAKRCDNLQDCPDQSDETSFMCTFPANSFPPSINKFENWSKTWVCDDGKTAIQKYLLCDGNFDCADHSDEFHCRCHNPRDYFDCTAWEHDPNLGKSNAVYTENGADCILRAMLCDGREHCRYGTDERAQLCKFLPPSFPISLDSLAVFFQNGYVIAATLFVLFLILAIPLYCLCYLCWRRDLKKNGKNDSSAQPDNSLHPASFTAAISQTLLSTTATPYHFNQNSGAFLRSPAAKSGVNFQQTAPSTSSGYCNYNSFPCPKTRFRPNNYQSLRRPLYNEVQHAQPEYLLSPTPSTTQPAVIMMSTCQSCSSPTPIFVGAQGGEANHQHYVQYYDIGGPPSTSSIVLPVPYCPPLIASGPTQHFYAPPPSAASLSTYGVVQPIGMPLPAQHCAESTSSGLSNVGRRAPLAASTPKHNNSLASNRRRRRQKRVQGRGKEEEEEVELVEYMPPPAYSQMVGEKRQEFKDQYVKGQKESKKLVHVIAGSSQQARMHDLVSDSIDSASFADRRKPSSNTTSSQDDS